MDFAIEFSESGAASNICFLAGTGNLLDVFAVLHFCTLLPCSPCTPSFDVHLVVLVAQLQLHLAVLALCPKLCFFEGNDHREAHSLVLGFMWEILEFKIRIELTIFLIVQATKSRNTIIYWLLCSYNFSNSCLAVA